MTVLYIFYGDHKGRKDELLQRAAEDYAGPEAGGAVVTRTEEGKPFFLGLPLSFSVSHTEGVWGCAISDSEVGIDVQVKRRVDFKKLAARFFLPSEAEYVAEKGLDGFFDIWTRKEACVKYHGTGLVKNIRWFSTVTDGKLAETIDFRGGICHVRSFDLSDEVKCAYCCKTGGAGLWVRELR